MRSHLVFPLPLVVCLLSAAHLHAQSPSPPSAPAGAKPVVAHDARTDRLRGLSKADLVRLEPQLEAGPVALVEFADDDADELPAINTAAIVHAPARELIGLIEKPEAYPHFMRTLDEVKVARRENGSLIYDWRWRLALLELSGRNAMTIYPASAERPDAGYRAVVDSQSGDLGTGRISIRVLPRGEHDAYLCVCLRIDLRTANYIARELASAARSVNRSANIALTYSMLLSFRKEAERRAGYRAPERPARDLYEPVLDLEAAKPLLRRGDLVLCDMSGDRLNQIAVFGVVPNDRELLRKVMLDADTFGASLLPGSAAKVVERNGPLTVFVWNIDLPLIGVAGRMQLRDADPLIAVDATEGALEGGRWKFETRALSRNATLLASWASFDVRNSSWLLRSLADTDPYLGHGIGAASEIMLERALRTETMDRAEELAKARKQQKK